MRPLIYSNLLIAGGAALVTHETYLLVGGALHWDPLLALVLCATLLVYSLDRLVDASEEDTVDRTERHRWIDRYRRILWGVAVTSAVGAAAATLFVSTDILVALVPLGAVAAAYSLPVVWGPSGPYRLKDVAGLKIFVITLVWAGATAFLPALQVSGELVSTTVVFTVVERAIFIFALTLPFDIRDMERDRASDIRTIPLAIGPDRTRTLALVCIGAFALIAVGHRGFGPGSAAIPLVASAAVTAVLLWVATTERTELYYVGALDGMIALQWIFVVGWTALVG